MELVNLKNQNKTIENRDHVDFSISAKKRRKMTQALKLTVFILSIMSTVLYIWDCATSYLVYKHWKSKFGKNEVFDGCIIAWLVVSFIGSVLAAIVTYNTFVHGLHFLCHYKGLHGLPHRITVFICYYFHEIPEAVIFLIFLTKFSVIPDEEDKVKTPSGFLGHTKYDQITYKVVFDVLKMIFMMVMSVIEYHEIAMKDRKLIFMIANMTAATIHMILLCLCTGWKIYLET